MANDFRVNLNDVEDIEVPRQPLRHLSFSQREFQVWRVVKKR